MGRKCEVFFCPFSEGRNLGKSFHGFPRDVERCSQWVENCCSPELSAAFAEGGPEAVRQLKICSDHFDTAAFKNPLQTSKASFTGSQPTLNKSRSRSGQGSRISVAVPPGVNLPWLGIVPTEVPASS